MLVNQYRPALGRRLDELPAGLLDVDGEAPLLAAQRELAEEAGLAAGRWDVLLDLNTSPGFSDEAIRIYLARDLHDPGEPDGFEAEHEEVSMTRDPRAAAPMRSHGCSPARSPTPLRPPASSLPRSAQTSGFAGLRPGRRAVGRSTGRDRPRRAHDSLRRPSYAAISTTSPSSAASRRTRWRPTGAT